MHSLPFSQIFREKLPWGFELLDVDALCKNSHFQLLTETCMGERQSLYGILQGVVGYKPPAYQSYQIVTKQ